MSNCHLMVKPIVLRQKNILKMKIDFIYLKYMILNMYFLRMSFRSKNVSVLASSQSYRFSMEIEIIKKRYGEFCPANEHYFYFVDSVEKFTV